MQVISTTGMESQAAQRPMKSTPRRRRSATRTVSGSRSLITELHQPEREVGEQDHQDQADELQDHEGNDALVDRLDLDFLRRDALDVEEGKAERRREERGLQVDREADQ